MRTPAALIAGLLATLLLPRAGLPAQAPRGGARSAVPEFVERIRDEGLNRSEVMKALGYLTDVIGPRLTNSPGMKRANEWTRDTMASWGLQNARLEAWGPFGRGWSLRRFSAQVVEPQAIPLIAYPKAWSPGLDNPLTARVVYVDARDEAGLESFRGKLKGAVVLNGAPRELKAHFEAEGARHTDRELLELANADAAAGGPGGQRRGPAAGDFRLQLALANRKLTFFAQEGAVLVIDPSRSGDGGTLFVQGASVPQPPAPVPTDASTGVGGATAADAAQRPAARVNAWDRNAPKILPQLVMASEHYNRLVRMLQLGEELRMRVDLSVQFHNSDLMGYNTVAELPGSDLKDEVVMLGAHLDSWHSGTGATDNGAGCAVVMEAARILQALRLQPRRTIRVALWSGEEQGLLGSKAYAAEHFGRLDVPEGAQPGTPGRLVTQPDHERFSAYYNLDNGTGKIRGVYLQGNEAVRPLFRQWLQPFADLGAATLTARSTGSTDHVSFDGIGLPGFQFIQDRIEYSTRTHHSNQDVFDRIQGDDLKQAAVIMAAFAYQTANLDQRLPRKPAAGR